MPQGTVNRPSRATARSLLASPTQSRPQREPSEALAAKTAQFKEKPAKLPSEMDRLKAIENAMRASPDQQISLTQIHVRWLQVAAAQVAVDTWHHLIVSALYSTSARLWLYRARLRTAIVIKSSSTARVLNRRVIQSQGNQPSRVVIAHTLAVNSASRANIWSRRSRALISQQHLRKKSHSIQF